MKKKSKAYIYKKFLRAAKDYLEDIDDESLSSVDGIQITMNQFLNAQGLPSVGIPFVNHDIDVNKDKRSFDEVCDDLHYYGIDS